MPRSQQGGELRRPLLDEEPDAERVEHGGDGGRIGMGGPQTAQRQPGQRGRRVGGGAPVDEERGDAVQRRRVGRRQPPLQQCAVGGAPRQRPDRAVIGALRRRRRGGARDVGGGTAQVTSRGRSACRR